MGGMKTPTLIRSVALAALSSAAPDTMLAACAVLRVRNGDRMQRLIPAGQFDAPRGAMRGQGPWTLDERGARAIMQAHAGRGTDILVDYEHQSLLAESNGKDVPASGWLDPTSFEWRADGDEPGLYGAVTWTPRAAQGIDGDEYRYLSPVFFYSADTGEVLGLESVALTNTPGIDDQLVAALSARSQSNARGGRTPAPSSQETSTVKLLEQLIAALGLSADTNEEAALGAVAALKSKADGAEAAQTELAALKASPTQPDPAKYVPIETMKAVQVELAALRGDFNANKVAGIVEQALTEGKLLPAQKQWAEDLGKKDLAALTGYLDSAAPIAALAGTQTKGKAPEGEQASKLTDAQLAVCKAMGISQDDYRKTLEAN